VGALFVFALIGAFPQPASPQGSGNATIAGVVSDAAGRPLSGVIVAIEELGLSVTTNATGRYSLARIPPGAHSLRFHRIGYVTYEAGVTVATDTLVTADAVLLSQPVELGAVTVEGASRAPDRLVDAPTALEVVRPATAGMVSLTGQPPRALARVPGLDVAQVSSSEFNINARGFNTMLSRKMLVLQDGRDLSVSAVGNQQWGALSEPLEDLSRIEVIRGPGSALYGANAYNGIISITTPDARDVLGAKVTIGGGERGTARADTRYAAVLGGNRVGVRVNGGYTRTADWSRSRTRNDGADWAEEYAPVTSTRPTKPNPEKTPLFGQTKDSVTGEALGTPDPFMTIYGSGRVDYYRADRSVLTLEGGTARMENAVWMSGNARTEAPHVLRPWARLAWQSDETSLSTWYSGASYPMVALSSGAQTYNSEHVFHAEAHTSHAIGGEAGRLVVGGSVQDNATDSRGTILPVALDDRHDQYYGAFGQLEYRVGHVRAIGALRWDDSNLHPAQLSPRGALIVNVTPNQSLRLTVDRAFFTPSLVLLFARRLGSPPKQNLLPIENSLRADSAVGPALVNVPPGTLFDNSAAVPESALGNPGLVPQRITSYGLGYKGQFGWRAFITVDLYAARINDFLTGLLPAGTTGINPAFVPWTAPTSVPDSSRALVEAAVSNALTDPTVRNGLTRLENGTTAVVLTFGNAGTVDEWGLELGANVSLTHELLVSTSYTWYDSRIHQAFPDDVVSPNTPQNKGTLALDYKRVGSIDLSLEARFVESYVWKTGIWNGTIPASQTVNMSGGYQLNPHLRVFASATNVFGEQRFEVYGGAVIGRRVLAGLTSTF
jgi:outer membrane receptor for ferrienterochelin and colicins